MELERRHYATAFLIAAALELGVLALWLGSAGPLPGLPGVGGRGQTGVRLSLQSASAPGTATMARTALAPAPLAPVPAPRPAPSTPDPVAKRADLVEPKRSVPDPPAVESAPRATDQPALALPDVAAAPPDATAPATGDANAGRGEGSVGRLEGAGAASEGVGSEAAGLRNDYLGAVWAKVNRLLSRRYPKRARRMGIEGTVVLGVSLERSGELRSVTLHESSGSGELDRHAQRTLERAAPFGEAPADLHDADLEFEIPLEYRLEGAR